MTMINSLMTRFWADDCGAVLTTEYLLLGSIMTLGAATGLNAMKDATVKECENYAQSVSTLSQSYTVPSQSSCGASKPGSSYIDIQQSARATP